MPYLLFLLLALVSCTPPGSEPVSQPRTTSEAFPVWWSSSELGVVRLADIDAELAKPFDGGITVNNAAKDKALVADCSSARDLQSKGYAAQYPRDIAVLGVLTAKCLALEALKSAKPARSSYMPERPYTPRVIEYLPAALAPAFSKDQLLAVERATKRGEPIRMVEVTVAFEAARDEEIHINGEGWQETLMVLGKGDFDGDQQQDWLLRSDLAVERGTYRNSRLFLVSRNSSDSVITVKRELKPGAE